ncbi:5-bromo-4-chloroindolyl phosphate hydrolysis protein OS=Tsukamurella paurometabola (strain ATCC 8368/ DSM / CCUG 35730 / CIP 100753 / JCM 10117 / KCTC 9821 / NBRC 16120 / NCIMB 702349 / NCTC 13040) OX=521096 GN=Tpau_2555 PE=4 SV=1 [Tsukamurella paurometabola]|uniref:Uncharacterized protein n=1 Tax=Tsukamurella paurometabola (strain ATCC 8368 / DSM 20162 / CCUG 35730 / CIP 100753 / JCM 10117 / KCTC 9821 / NBRC 16120 / NCIMB 702349 / NCTC 13040) TaxID=521096 RepID=D5URV3_TSUPD|nr:hypothetical protein [Tsukamurella paurometabola]ADG79158.1 hypothetical protein Tpau_2555 [Tsukamurella paurometabola DSM 20162]SUP34328.1 Uncharacterised protein [Tsukamurella paurometabola]
MAETVPKDIAVRVTSAADAVVVGREMAQVAARDASAYLEGIRPAAIDDAYRRYTASNNPAYLASLRPTATPWGFPAGMWVALGVALFIMGTAIGSMEFGFLLLLLTGGGLGGLRIWQSVQHKKTFAATEQARLAANPWPFQADRTPAYNPEAEPGNTRVETRLLGLAVLISEEIRRSPAWNNPILDQHRVRINLDATLHDISHRAYRVWKLRTDTPRPSGESTVTPVLAEHLDEYATAARMAENALRDHVAALAEYLGELRPVERLLHDLQLLDRTNTSAHRELLDQLYRDAIGNEADARRYQQHADELRDLQASLDTQFHFLREQVSRTNLLR